jgi:hypothetical protein
MKTGKSRSVDIDLLWRFAEGGSLASQRVFGPLKADATFGVAERGRIGGGGRTSGLRHVGFVALRGFDPAALQPAHRRIAPRMERQPWREASGRELEVLGARVYYDPIFDRPELSHLQLELRAGAPGPRQQRRGPLAAGERLVTLLLGLEEYGARLHLVLRFRDDRWLVTRSEGTPSPYYHHH